MGGQAVNFIITQAADQGSYALNGQDVTFHLATFMVASSGSFASNGQAVAFKSTETADPGTYALNGQDALFTLGQSVVADTGTFTSSGQAVTFRITTAASEGSFSVNGQDLLMALRMAAANGSYTLMGEDADLIMVYVPPAFDTSLSDVTVYQDDVGLHLQAADMGWKVIQVSVRLNVKKG